MVGLVDIDSNTNDDDDLMDVCSSPGLMDELFSDDEHKCVEAIGELRKVLIGSKRQKEWVIERGVVPRLVHLIEQSSQQRLRVDVAFALCSLAKGGEAIARALIDNEVVPALIRGLEDREERVVEACLCCLRTLFQHPEAPTEALLSQSRIVDTLISVMPKSTNNQIAVAAIVAQACKKKSDQDGLSESHSLIHALHTQLLLSTSWHVQFPSLNALASLCYRNEQVAAQICHSRPSSATLQCSEEYRKLEHWGSFDSYDLLEMIVGYLDRNSRHPELQLAAAKCITHVYRCGFIDEKDPKIVYKTMPCLVRMVKKPLSLNIRVEAANVLAELLEMSGYLQRIASISDHLLATMSSFIVMITSSTDPRCAAFRVLAPLAANDEDIRKRVAATDNLMPSLINAVSKVEEKEVSSLEEFELNIVLAAIGCLHSLSRSVQLLRTAFQDHSAWQPLTYIIKRFEEYTSTNNSRVIEILIKASSTLCNLLLEFSPSKQLILDEGAVELFTQLTHRPEPHLRLNAVWALMNLAFDAEEDLKVEIMNCMGSDQMFRLLYDSHDAVVMKTLGLLRNLLASKQHVDHIMTAHGREVMQAMVMILESDRCTEVKEQALCILTNIAAGESAKSFIMSNEDILKKLANYMMHHNNKLQMAAVFCVHNLVFTDDGEDVDNKNNNNAHNRRQRLKEIGVHKILQQIQLTATQLLHDKVTDALSQLTPT